ncbi:MAG: alpha/beta hydrolase, partial [Candidatus Eremiobacteraeota bacterium]|nr:alpha/beta hydrolase [Candidatus Eremiobacteraeota bacterium]
MHASFDDARMEMQVVNVTIDGAQLHVARSGNGSSNVLIHGFPFSHSLWNKQIEALSASCDVVAPDLRGMGKS